MCGRFFAKHGLERTSDVQILSDLSIFYRGSTSLARAGRAFFKQLRGHSKSKIDTLIKLAPNAIQTPLRTAFTALKGSQHKSITTAIDSMILVLIKAGGRAELIKQLNTMAFNSP